MDLPELTPDLTPDLTPVLLYDPDLFEVALKERVQAIDLKKCYRFYNLFTELLMENIVQKLLRITEEEEEHGADPVPGFWIRSIPGNMEDESRLDTACLVKLLQRINDHKELLNVSKDTKIG